MVPMVHVLPWYHTTGTNGIAIHMCTMVLEYDGRTGTTASSTGERQCWDALAGPQLQWSRECCNRRGDTWIKYDQDNFIPFILETGGRVNKAARDWLDALTAPEPGEQVPSQDDHPWNPQTRTTTETVVLREAMQALVTRRWCACRPACLLRGLWWRSALQTSIAVELEP
jgi:hypothetical protein